MAGMLASVYPATGMFRVVEALGKADKDVDLLIACNSEGFIMGSHQQRRVWDYLVKYLQGIEPAQAFKLGEFNW